MEILARDRKYQNFPFISTFFYHMQLKGAFSSWNEVAGVHKIIDRLLSRSKKPNAPFLHVE